MSFRRSESQQYFESLFSGPKGKPFIGLPKDKYENTTLNSIQATKLSQLLDGEIASHYYKAILSYAESLRSVSSKNYSWATVKLYYSVFYSTKAFLACKGIALFRAERRMFYVKARDGENIKKCKEHTDHKATILTLIDLYKDQDKLQSNTINSKSTYEWMMEKREEVNYKDIDFHDPDAPEFWEEIRDELNSVDIFSLVDKFVKDNWLLCFQDNYGILGIPTKRLILTVNAIRLSGKTISINNKKKKYIENILEKVSEESKQELLVWTEY